MNVRAIDAEIKALEKYRLLDFDDILIFKLLRDGYTKGQIAMYLKITAPAVSHRFKKYREVFGIKFLSGYQKSRGGLHCSRSADIVLDKIMEVHLLAVESLKHVSEI